MFVLTHFVIESTWVYLYHSITERRDGSPVFIAYIYIKQKDIICFKMITFVW